MTPGAALGIGAALAAAVVAAPVEAAPSVAEAVARPSACFAPSRATTRLDLATCSFTPPAGRELAGRCGLGGAAIDLDRLDAAVPALDPATRRHVRDVARRGQALGRRRGVFGLLGDSVTESTWFLAPFASPARTHTSAAVDARLRLRDGRSIIDVLRGIEASAGVSSFGAFRAARTGARATWALPAGGGHAPVVELVDRLSPEIVVVLFGSNDARVRFAEPAALAASFREVMGRIAGALEDRGVIPLLTTIPRQGQEPGRPDCDRAAGDLSSHRIAAQLEALNEVVLDLACERALPVVDLRHALDALPNAGLGPDGVHPVGHRDGAGRLDEVALACGMNARNYVTLRALAGLRDALDGG